MDRDVVLDIEAAGPRRVDHGERGAGPTELTGARGLVVIDLHRDSGLLGHADRLPHRDQQAAGFIAHMRHVDPAMPSRDLGQLDHLFDSGVVGGHVQEPGAQAERAVTHIGLDHRLHLLQLPWRRGPVDETHDRPANRGVPREVPDVRGCPEPVEIRTERPWRITAVHRRQQRGDSLEQKVLGQRTVVDIGCYVRMMIDEARRDRESRHIELDLPAARSNPVPSHADDPVTLQRDVGPESGAPDPSTTVPPRSTTSYC